MSEQGERFYVPEEPEIEGGAEFWLVCVETDGGRKSTEVATCYTRERGARIAAALNAQAERERDEAVRKVHAVEEAFEPKGEWSDQMHPTVNGICPECYSLGFEAAEAQVRELVEWRRGFTDVVAVGGHDYVTHIGPAPTEATITSHYAVEPCAKVYPDGTTECDWLEAHKEAAGD